MVSLQLVAELDEVLARKKFRRWLSKTDARRFVSDVRKLAETRPDPPPSQAPVTADPDDEFLVALTQAAGVVALISGHPHLTELTDLDPPVLHPAAFLELIGEDTR